MSEINRVQGPGGAESGGRKDRSGNVDDDKFRKIMKVEEVREIDPREKRKRKRAEETEDETEGLKKASGIPTDAKKAKQLTDDEGNPLAVKKTHAAKQHHPPATKDSSHSTPLSSFSAQEIEPFAWKEEGEEAQSSSIESTKKGAAPSTTSPTIEGISDPLLNKGAIKSLNASEEPPLPPSSLHEKPQLHFENEEDFREQALPKESTIGQTPMAQNWPQTLPLQPGSELSLSSPSVPRVQNQETIDTETTKRKDDSLRKKNNLEERDLPPKQEKKTSSFVDHMKEEDGKKKLEAEDSSKKHAQKAAKAEDLKENSGFSSQKKTGATTISDKDKERAEKGGNEEGITPLSGIYEAGNNKGGEQQHEQGKKHPSSGSEEGEVSPGYVPAVSSLPQAGPTEITPPTASYSQMEPQILALFERMVGVMTIIQTTGISETVMTLNARQFASSVLYGSQVIIREFSTAPKAFNVEFIGSPEALAQVQRNLPALLGAVQQGNYAFSINRFDTKLGSTEKPIFSRKESVGENTDQSLNDQDKEQNSP